MSEGGKEGVCMYFGEQKTWLLFSLLRQVPRISAGKG